MDVLTDYIVLTIIFGFNLAFYGLSYWRHGVALTFLSAIFWFVTAILWLVTTTYPEVAFVFMAGGILQIVNGLADSTRPTA